MRTIILAVAASAFPYFGVACADELVTVPAGCAVTSIHAKLHRAENSYVTFATNRLGNWRDDGRTGVLENQGSTDYRPRYPRLFAPSRRAYQIRVGGQFSIGRWVPWVRSDEDTHPVETYPDHAIVKLYGGAREPANTTVTIRFGGPRCPSA